MKKRPVVWSIAGSDPSGGAGIQQDLATFDDFKVHGCSVITLLTAQNCSAMKVVKHCSFDVITAQIQMLQHDFAPDAIKLGAFGSSAGILATAQYLATYNKAVVCDPVMCASAGDELLNQNLIPLLIKYIFPHVTLVTPNIAEAEKLTQQTVQNDADIVVAAQKILALGVNSVLIKGGHRSGIAAADYFCDKDQAFWLHSVKLHKPQVRGTGCLLSSAITALLSLDYCLSDALVIAKMYINQEIRNSISRGSKQSIAFSQHLGWPLQQQDLPLITQVAAAKPLKFASCAETLSGLYPIVDHVDWVKKLIKHGVHNIQLRIKNKSNDYTEQMIKESVQLCRDNNVGLFINDYWQLAIKYQAYGVHLGQQDLQTADLSAIAQSGIRLGISTHCFYEVARAHAYQPSYIAFGPIYETKSKMMTFSPRGLQQLAYWRQVLRYPLVAIGGINLDRIADVLATGVDAISVISAITQSVDPDFAIKKLSSSGIPAVMAPFVLKQSSLRCGTARERGHHRGNS